MAGDEVSGGESTERPVSAEASPDVLTVLYDPAERHLRHTTQTADQEEAMISFVPKNDAVAGDGCILVVFGTHAILLRTSGIASKTKSGNVCEYHLATREFAADDCRRRRGI